MEKFSKIIFKRYDLLEMWKYLCENSRAIHSVSWKYEKFLHCSKFFSKKHVDFSKYISSSFQNFHEYLALFWQILEYCATILRVRNYRWNKNSYSYFWLKREFRMLPSGMWNLIENYVIIFILTKKKNDKWTWTKKEK